MTNKIGVVSNFSIQHNIMLTCPCNVDPLIPNFSIVLNRLNEAVLACTHNLCFEQKTLKISYAVIFHLIITIFTALKNRSILYRHVCVMFKPIIHMISEN